VILYKAWRESRTRFLLSALILAGFCFTFVWYAHTIRASLEYATSYNAYIWKTIYKGDLREVYVVLVLFLGAGGLLRESDGGTSGLTLSYPVLRARHLLDRAVVGIVEVLALTAIPALIVPVISRWRSESYAWSQAWKFALLWAFCGAVTFAISFLASAIFRGEYTAPLVSLVVLIVYSMIADIPAIERRVSDLHDVMNGDGMAYIDTSAAVFTGPIPWTTMLTLALVTVAILGLSLLVTLRRDF
jgi:ABC-2 type transport system permease protein